MSHAVSQKRKHQRERSTSTTAELCEVTVRFGFTDDILRSPEFAGIEGVELRDKAPDCNEGCLMSPAGATIVIGIPEDELLPFEVLAESWQADGFRHAGFGYREFVVPAGWSTGMTGPCTPGTTRPAESGRRCHEHRILRPPPRSAARGRGARPLTRLPHDTTCQEGTIMNDIDLDQPVQVTPRLARAIAATLSGSYPETTAEMVTRDLAKAHGDGRGIIGLFAADALRDAIDQGAVGPDAAGVLEVRV